VRSQLGLAPQETGVYPSLTARDNLRFFADLAGLRGRDRKEAITSVADALQLTDLLDRPALHLSGGERRRLHTALALVHRPQLVMLDEPTTGADVRTRAQLLKLVGELAAAGSAVVYSTHYLGEVEQLDASVVVIDNGHVIARGGVTELVATHAANVVEMTFAGPAPVIVPVASDDRIERDGSVVRVHTRHPETVPALIEQLGPGATRLRGLDVRRPSLEAAFLELTGRRLDGEEVTADVA
jgi:ABC-2 type transport system ATP-binding protein